MKYLFFLLFIAACGSSPQEKKEKIVKRQMQLNTLMKPWMDSLVITTGSDTFKDNVFRDRIRPLRNEFDSLEFELKKY